MGVVLCCYERGIARAASSTGVGWRSAHCGNELSVEEFGTRARNSNHGKKKSRRNVLIVDCLVTKNGKPLKSMMVLKSFERSFI